MTEHPEPSVARPKWWAPPCYLLGLGLVVWGLFVLGRPYYVGEDLREDLQKLRELDEARYIVVGASHGKGVDLEELGVRGQNLSHNGQDLFEMAYIARSAANRAPQLETVIVTLSYFSFALDNGATEARGVRNRIGRRIEMYAAFPRAAFVPGDHAEFVKGLLYPIVTRDHFQRGFERNLRRLLRAFSNRPTRAKRSNARAADSGRADDTDRSSADDDADDEGLDEPEPTDDAEAKPEAEPLVSGHAEGEPDVAPDAESKRERPAFAKRHTVKNEAWYARHAAGRCRQYTNLMDNSHAHHPELERDAYRELLGLVQDLEAKHVSVVLLTPPYLPAYSSCFDARMQRLTRINGRKVMQATHARYFDLSSEESITSRPGLFIDSDHLRPHGKALLARKLADLLHLKRP